MFNLVKRYSEVFNTHPVHGSNIQSSSAYGFLSHSLLDMTRLAPLIKEKGRDLTQSFDKSPYTNTNLNT